MKPHQPIIRRPRRNGDWRLCVDGDELRHVRCIGGGIDPGAGEGKTAERRTDDINPLAGIGLHWQRKVTDVGCSSVQHDHITRVGGLQGILEVGAGMGRLGGSVRQVEGRINVDLGTLRDRLPGRCLRSEAPRAQGGKQDDK